MNGTVMMKIVMTYGHDATNMARATSFSSALMVGTE
jgi:hypothetical protein